MHRSSVTAVRHREMSMSSQGGYSSVHRPLAAVAIACLLTVGCTGKSDHQVPPSTAPTISTNAVAEPVKPCGSVVRLEVPGTSNIFGAGIADPPAPAGGGGGTAPPCVSFPPTVTSILIRANGKVDFLTRNEDDNVHFHRCVGGPPQIFAPPEGPDGQTTWSCVASPEATSFAPKPLSITAVGSISGISSADGGGYLIGVFLADTVPAGPPPATLDFTGNRDFASLSPALAQTFVIGDGRTATGRPQRFHVPTGATRLYFGFGDAWSFVGPPGFYADNSGSLKVAVRFH
jgi:hypothetical protein